MEPEDYVIKNHIYLAAVDETAFNRASTVKKGIKSPYI
jgi:hypothetical protein